MDKIESADSRAPDCNEDIAAGSLSVQLRRIFNEGCGTFFLVGVDSGGAMISSLSGGEPTPTARSLTAGLVIMMLVYATGDVSGAHFNPAVTLAFAIRRDFPWRWVPFYWAAQLAGAFLACGMLELLFGNVANLGATLPPMGQGAAFGIEVFVTCVLICGILGTAVRHRVLGPNAALASGGAVALGGMLARSVSGASMNPARSLAPAVISGQLSGLWIYLLAPPLGAAVATGIMAVIHVHKHSEERTAARGEK